MDRSNGIDENKAKEAILCLGALQGWMLADGMLAVAESIGFACLPRC